MKLVNVAFSAVYVAGIFLCGNMQSNYDYDTETAKWGCCTAVTGRKFDRCPHIPKTPPKDDPNKYKYKDKHGKWKDSMTRASFCTNVRNVGIPLCDKTKKYIPGTPHAIKHPVKRASAAKPKGWFGGRRLFSDA